MSEEKVRLKVGQVWKKGNHTRRIITFRENVVVYKTDSEYSKGKPRERAGDVFMRWAKTAELVGKVGE